ncbi:MAG: ATP-binding protein [Thermoleophilaceae bacterium]
MTAEVAERRVFELPARPTAGSDARRALLADEQALPGSVRDDVLLLLTELVTNAVRHADGDTSRAVRVELRQWEQTVEVMVFDEGAAFTAGSPVAKPDGSGGWGLFLVDRIADRWAITRAPSGTCAWFEIGCGQ